MELPIATGGPTGPGEEAHQLSGSNVPTPRYHRYRVTHAGSYSLTQHAFSEPTLIKVAKGVLHAHVGGTVTHRARYSDLCMIMYNHFIFLNGIQLKKGFIIHLGKPVLRHFLPYWS